MTRFRDLQLKRAPIAFLAAPFNVETHCWKAPLATGEAAAELEMINLCEEHQLKPALREGAIEFWKSVKELLRVAATEYKPDLKRIVQSKECQKSH